MTATATAFLPRKYIVILLRQMIYAWLLSRGTVVTRQQSMSNVLFFYIFGKVPFSKLRVHWELLSASDKFLQLWLRPIFNKDFPS